MIYSDGAHRAVSSVSEDNSATFIDQDNGDIQLNRDANGNDMREERALEKENHPIIEVNDNFPQNIAMETYSNEKFDEPDRKEEKHEIIETNGNFPQEVAIETYSHEEFDKLVQEEKYEVSIETYSHEEESNHPIIEINDNFPREIAMETYSHDDVDKIVQEEETQQIIKTSDNLPLETKTAIETFSHEDFDKLVQEEETRQTNKIQSNMPQETAIETYSHEDFDKFVREKETSESDINARVESAFESYSHEAFENLIREEETSENNIHIRVESAFESYTHQDFENLVQEDSHPLDETKNTSNGSYENVDTTLREEVTAHHTKTGFRNPTDTRDQNILPEVQKDPTRTANPQSLSSDVVTGVSVVSTKNPATVVTAPPVSTDLDTNAANILQNPNPNNQITITYLSFFLMVAAMVALSLAIWVIRRRRSNRQKREVYEYLGAFDIEDIDLRRAITGGWHGQYKNNLAKGLNNDSDFETYSDSDEGSRTSDSGADETTIVFLERGDLSSPIQSKKRSLPFTMLVADRNIYLDESTNGADSDDDDIFSPVRTRPF